MKEDTIGTRISEIFKKIEVLNNNNSVPKKSVSSASQTNYLIAVSATGDGFEFKLCPVFVTVESRRVGAIRIMGRGFNAQNIQIIV